MGEYDSLVPDLIDSLKTRYEAALQSGSEPLFYQNIHGYWDFITRTPALSELVEASQKEYSQKHGELWDKPGRTEEELDDHEERTMRLERFSLYAVGTLTLVRIYEPIEDYKNSLHESEFDQDPRAVVMMRGVKNINPQYGKKNPFKWGKEHLRSLDHWYNGKRPMYERSLKQFHLMLVDALEKTELTPPSKEVLFDVERSTLTLAGKVVRITLKNDKPNAHYVLEYLFAHGLANQAFYTDILEEQFPRNRMSWRSVYRACKDIETKVRVQAGITDFLTTTTGKTGWVRINPPYA